MLSTALKTESKSLNRDCLHHYQNKMKEFIKNIPNCAMFAEMGVGKSVSTATAIQDLYDELEVYKVLIIAPLRVARSTWPKELEIWDHISLKYSVVHGPVMSRCSALEKDAEVYLINRENVPWLVEWYGNAWPFDMVVIDESTSFKNPSSKRFKALKRVRKYINRMVLLTGTPAPNSLLDLWAQVYLLDQGDRLGKTFTLFKERYFESDYMGYKWSPRPETEEAIYDKLTDISLTMQAKDYLEMPPITYNRVEVAMTPQIAKQYKQMEDQCLMELEGEEITAMSAAALTNKLLQLANGAAYTESGSYRVFHDLKLEALAEIVELNEGKPILVAYNYKFDLDRLIKKFPGAKVLDKDPATIDKWNNGEYPMLLCQPQSAGHGLNLQRGGNLLVWFGLSWSLELYQQFNARLYRQGQQHGVVVHHVITQGTMDENVMAALGTKDATQSALIDALKQRLAK